MEPSPTYSSEDCHAVHERAGEGPYPDTGEGASVSLSQHTICSLWILYIYSPDEVDQLFLITEKICDHIYVHRFIFWVILKTHSLMTASAWPLQVSLWRTLYLAVRCHRSLVHSSRAERGNNKYFRLYLCEEITNNSDFICLVRNFDHSIFIWCNKICESHIWSVTNRCRHAGSTRDIKYTKWEKNVFISFLSGPACQLQPAVRFYYLKCGRTTEHVASQQQDHAHLGVKVRERSISFCYLLD